MFQEDQTIQPQLFAFSHRDLVQADSDVWLYVDLFESLDLKRFTEVHVPQGQEAKHPRLMLRALFYGLTHGVVSGRKLETVCRNDNRFIVLCGGLRPDRRTFDRFIERHAKAIEELFVQVVHLAQAMGLVQLGRVAIDGTRLKGHTSLTRSMQYEKMDRAIGHIQADLARLREDLKKADHEEQATGTEDQLPKEILRKEVRLEKIKRAKEQIEKERQEKTASSQSRKPIEKARKSLNDPEAISLGSRKSAYIFGYNGQAAVDEKSQIIVACEIHGKATDYEALPGLLNQMRETCGSAPAQVLADLGYKSVENIAAIELAGSEPIIAVGQSQSLGKQEIIEVQFSEQVRPGDLPHEYFCLNGKKLPLEAKRATGQTDFKITVGFCDHCPFTTSCKAFGKKTAAIKPEQDRLRINRLLAASRTEAFQEAYRRRKAIVEPVFGNLKSNKGVRIFRVGAKGVGTWWKLVCTAHNIEKLVKRGAMKRTSALIRSLQQILTNHPQFRWV